MSDQALLDRVGGCVRNGHIVYPVLVLVLALFGYILFCTDTVLHDTRYSQSTESTARQYTIRMVSALPEESEAVRESKAEASGSGGRINPNLRAEYISYVVSRIEQNKVYPPEEERAGHEGVVEFALLITRDGTVRKLSFLRKSRYGALNEAAVRAVQHSLPLARFPALMEEESIKVHVTMNFFLE
ncbi:MAG: TonB family protein [Spirochaetota bacterium]